MSSQVLKPNSIDLSMILEVGFWFYDAVTDLPPPSHISGYLININKGEIYNPEQSSSKEVT